MEGTNYADNIRLLYKNRESFLISFILNLAFEGRKSDIINIYSILDIIKKDRVIVRL